MKMHKFYYMPVGTVRVEKVKLLGPEDFEGYERNRFNKRWHLIEDGKGEQVWTANLYPTYAEAEARRKKVKMERKI